MSWFCCSHFAGDICEKKSLSSHKTVANAYAAIIYFISHVTLAVVKTVLNSRSDLFATNPLLQLFTTMGLKHREQQPLLLQPGAHGHAMSTCPHPLPPWCHGWCFQAESPQPGSFHSQGEVLFSCHRASKLVRFCLNKLALRFFGFAPHSKMILCYLENTLN